ncbi:MAG: hypothetical protein FWF20_02265 [Betaproteobacteria bacterium]|nr:hypothetical protein [Betaproteobacteria bacterium]MCL2885607.1 hypothetical protein [Betaproteobacteria bacterium]
MQKWTQDEAIAFECACECITDLRAILTSERYHDNPTPERLAEIEVELSGLRAEREMLSVHDHAEIARIRCDYGRRICYHRMNEPAARAYLETLGLSFAVAGVQIGSADSWREVGRLAFEAVECVTFERPADDGSWLLIGEHLGQPDAAGWITQRVAVQRPYWIRKSDLPRLQEIESYLAAKAHTGS